MTWTQLHDACEHQLTERVRHLATVSPEQAFQVEAHRSTPLHLLCWGNPKPEAVAALLTVYPQACSDQDIHGDTPLHIACSYPETDKHLVHMLVDACPESASMTNHEGLMPLHKAVREAPHNETVIGFLIDVFPYALLTHIKIGEPAPRKKRIPSLTREPDHVATDPSAGMKTKDAADLRLDTYRQVRDGSYPLHMAISSGAPQAVVEMLLKEAPEIQLKTNKYGQTPLHVALMQPQPDTDELVQVLVQCEPKAVSMRDSVHGNYPIHTAVSHGCSVGVCKCLLETRPDLAKEVNSQGLTPMELAIRHSNCTNDVLRLLEISSRVGSR